MAVLHDGQQFLVQKYTISNALGFQIGSKSKQKKLQEYQALIFGLTLEVPPFNPLPNVKAETQTVQQILGGERFLNQSFTWETLEQEMEAQKVPIVHIATHGKFAGSADRSFLLTFNRQLLLKEFENLLRKRQQEKPIVLLTLSACETAAGDNRATLGMAGLAVRNGIENVLASLWSVNDGNILPLIEDFYKILKQPGITAQEALRKAQINSLLKFQTKHPSIWANFILISDSI